MQCFFSLFARCPRVLCQSQGFVGQVLTNKTLNFSTGCFKGSHLGSNLGGPLEMIYAVFSLSRKFWQKIRNQ